MAKHKLSQEIVKETKEAIKQFGRYSFTDKGPHEVMNVSPLSNKFKKLSQAEKIQVAKDLKKDSDATRVLVELIGDADLSDKQIDEIVQVGGSEIADHYAPPTAGVTYGAMKITDLFKK